MEKRVAAAQFKMASLQQGLSPDDDPSRPVTNRISNELDHLYKRLDSLGEDIAKGVSDNADIRKELRSREVSLYPDFIDNPAEYPGSFDGDLD